MCKKLLILSLSITLLFVIIAPITPVYAGDNGVKVNWQIVGTIVQTIPVYNPTDQTLIGNHSLINLSAQGSPGPAKITLLSMSGPNPDSISLKCEGWDMGIEPIAYFIKNDMVAVFPDQSFLFASIDTGGGILCPNIYGTGTYFTIEMSITGGTGRFEGASGNLTGEGYGYWVAPPFGDPPNSDLTLLGDYGTITGDIEFPD